MPRSLKLPLRQVPSRPISAAYVIHHFGKRSDYDESMNDRTIEWIIGATAILAAALILRGEPAAQIERWLA